MKITPNIAIATALLATNTMAFTADSSSRRQFFNSIVGSGMAGVAILSSDAQVASATAAKTGASSPFTGFYDDPNHPNCLRQVKVVGAPLRGDGTRSPIPILEVKGYDGNGSSKTCTERPTRADLWSVEGKVLSNNEAVIDFSPKGGPSKLVAKYEGDGIVFPDGNKWTKVMGGTSSRLPKDMSTLKSE